MLKSRTFMMLFLILGCIFLPNQILSQTDATIKTLKGFDTLKVEVEQLAPDLQNAGIKTEQIQTDVETKLRQAGFKVKSANEPMVPYVVLYVSVNSIDNGVGGFAVSVHTSLNQFVVLERNKSVTTVAGTWQSRSIVSVYKEKVQAIRGFVELQVDLFINAHRKANDSKPVQPIKK